MRNLAGEEPACSQPERRSVAPVAPRGVSLLRLVERVVLPRLAQQQAPVRRDRFGDGLGRHVSVLADLALGADDARARSLLHRLHHDGRTFSQLQLGLVAPAARQFDTHWKSDRATFVEVTEAMGLLKRLMRYVALDLSPRHQGRFRYKTVLVAPAPGDGHNFGASMAAEYFRRDGWAVHHVPGGDAAAFAKLAAQEWLDVAAFSLTLPERRGALADAISLIRRSSLNPRIVVVVGGEAIVQQPSLSAAIGADAAVAPLPVVPARVMRLVRTMYGVGG
jgi:methylmalonyl-CoA mutase cobalamin-binding subunit